MWTVFGEKRWFERTVIIWLWDNATLRHRKICPDPRLDQISHFWSDRNKIVLLWRPKPYFFGLKNTFWLFQKCVTPCYQLTYILKQKRDIQSVHVPLLFQISVHISSHFWSIFLHREMHFQSMCSKSHCWQVGGTPPSFLKRWNPLASEHRRFTCCLL